jgi:hypothetical protein
MSIAAPWLQRWKLFGCSYPSATIVWLSIDLGTRRTQIKHARALAAAAGGLQFDVSLR